MDSQCINIYLPKGVDTESFPDDLYGQFKVAQDYKIESSWTFFLMLANQGVEVQICNEFPSSGILVIHKAFAVHFDRNPNLFVVSMQWDYKRDDRAQVHLVSNHFKTRTSSLDWLDRISFPGLRFYVQPPTHSCLTMRNADRGNRFETLAFLGAEKNLAADFRTDSFRQRIEALGMKFIIVSDPDKMNDYSEIDAVLAVRKLGRRIAHKPPQKLINAWRAGVPAILGREVGYQELHESDVDYLEVNSVEEVVQALERLKSDPLFRERMSNNGLAKAERYTPEAIEKVWCDLVRDRIIPAYHEWMAKSRIQRKLFLSIRHVRYISRLIRSFIWHKVLHVRARS